MNRWDAENKIQEKAGRSVSVSLDNDLSKWEIEDVMNEAYKKDAKLSLTFSITKNNTYSFSKWEIEDLMNEAYKKDVKLSLAIQIGSDCFSDFSKWEIVDLMKEAYKKDIKLSISLSGKNFDDYDKNDMKNDASRYGCTFKAR